MWNIALYGAKTWTVGKVDQKYTCCFEIWCWRRMEKTSWTDRVKTTEVLHKVIKEKYIHTIKRGKGKG
jgi:hypothetical protein